MKWENFIQIIKNNLTDDLLLPKFRKIKQKAKLPNEFGHCYVASEAAYHLLGGRDNGWFSYHINYNGLSHWFLKHSSGAILDLTKNQFKTKIDYKLGRRKGFLTKCPSKRTKILIMRIQNEIRY